MNGSQPIPVGSETRSFIQDGDELILKGRVANASGIGFGHAGGVVLPARNNDS